MPRGKLPLLRGTNHDRHIPFETEDVNAESHATPSFRSLSNIASSTVRSASLPSRFGNKASSFLVAVDCWISEFLAPHLLTLPRSHMCAFFFVTMRQADFQG